MINVINTKNLGNQFRFIFLFTCWRVDRIFSRGLLKFRSPRGPSPYPPPSNRVPSPVPLERRWRRLNCATPPPLPVCINAARHRSSRPWCRLLGVVLIARSLFWCFQMSSARQNAGHAVPMAHRGRRVPPRRIGRRHVGRNVDNDVDVSDRRTSIQVHMMSDEEILNDPVLCVAFYRGRLSANRLVLPPPPPPGFAYVGPMDIQYELDPTAPQPLSPPSPGMPPQYDVAQDENGFIILLDREENVE